MLGDGCTNNCSFCTQAIENDSSKDHLSRVMWPEFEWEDVIGKLAVSDQMKRACFQTLTYDGMVDDLLELVKELKKINIPTSAAVEPMDDDDLARLKDAGLGRIGISLDAASRSVFENVKGSLVGNPYSWEEHLRSLEKASQVFKGKTSTHIIVGLGETDEDIMNILGWCNSRNITVGLFAYTSFPGVRCDGEPPNLDRYRVIQGLRYLMLNGHIGPSDTTISNGRLVGLGNGSNILYKIGPEAFETSGCKNCNRPYYNERVRGPAYNYPRPLTDNEHTESINLIKRYLRE